MKKLLYLCCLLSFQFAFAQSELPEGFGDYRTIENPEPGKTYTQAYIPPTFKTIVWRDSILLLNNNQHLLTNLTEGRDYEIITEVVEIRPAYTIWEFEAPKIDTIWEIKMIVVDRICEEIEPMPEYENQIIIERKEIFKAEFSFLHRNMGQMKDCMDLSPNSISYVMFEIPAYYKSIEKRVFQKDEKWWTETITDTLNVQRKKLKSSFYTINKKEILVIKDTLQFITFINKIPLNASFSMINKNVINEKGNFTKWKEVICYRCSLNSNVITRLQEVFRKEGYDVHINNIFDEKTKKALVQFKIDNNLLPATAEIDKETLKALEQKGFVK